MRLALVRQRYSAYGGAERFIERALGALGKQGVAVTVIALPTGMLVPFAGLTIATVGAAFALIVTPAEVVFAPILSVATAVSV